MARRLQACAGLGRCGVAIGSIAFLLTLGGTVARSTPAMDSCRSAERPPVFRPFVLVRVPMIDGMQRGEVTAVNDDGEAFGWMEGETGRRSFAFHHLRVRWLDDPHSVPPGRMDNGRGESILAPDDGAPALRLRTQRHGVERIHVLSDLTLMPESTGRIASARAINDNGWIGGSYLAGGTGDPQPCLIIPYDVNNDEVPDYRQILEGKRQGVTDVDTNDNWLLDAGELMRVGLHAPGQSIHSHGIDNTQVIRNPLQLRNLDFNIEQPGENPDEWPLDAILGDEELCCGFVENINNWTRVSGNREMIYWLRSTLIAADEEFDYLPDGLSGINKDDILDDIREFGYKFARCIDYVKTGNEVFGGAGGYKFYSGQLGACTWTGGTAKTFQQVRDDLGETCAGIAGDKVIEWLNQQAWAALEGSALAGRPLRIIGPAIQSGFINAAYNGTGVLDDMMIDLVDWCNANQIYFDAHILYISLAEAEATIEKLTGTGQTWTNPPWDDADWIVCTELGPIVGDAFNNTPNNLVFQAFANCGSPGETWWEFVRRWREAQFMQQGEEDFGIADALAACGAPGGDAARAFALVCYGPTIQHPEPIFGFDMGALRATNVCGQLIGNGQGTTLYTPLKEMYEDAADPYVISSFNPHPSACVVCQCN